MARGVGLSRRWFAPFSTLAAVQAAAHALSPSPIQRGPVRGPLEDRAIAGEDGAATGRRALWDLTPAGLPLPPSWPWSYRRSRPPTSDGARPLASAAIASGRRHWLLLPDGEAAAWLADRARSGETGHSARAVHDHQRRAELLGDHAPKKWLNVELISAAKARDVTCCAELGVMSRSESARLGAKREPRKCSGAPAL